MGRDRSRSRSREHRRRSRSRSGGRDRERDHRRDTDKNRERRRRSKSKDRKRHSRSRSPHEKRAFKEYKEERSDRDRKKKREPAVQEPITTESLLNAEDEMAKLMGFGKFDTTKNKKVNGNYEGEVRINKMRRYRQYMNRKGGFNRPLDYVA